MSGPFLDLMVGRRDEQADGIVVLDLVAPDGSSLPVFEPGAHVDVHVEPGLIRQYSLCGRPADTSRYRLGVLLDAASRGGSAAVHRKLRVGEPVRVGVPRNHFPLEEAAERSVLVGGGIGITPLLAMAYHLDAAGGDFALHYCARTRGGAAFLAELSDVAFHDRVHLHFDDEPPPQRLELSRALPPPASGTHLYVCGPIGFMDWVIAGARVLGYEEAQIHREYFAAKADTSGSTFEVVLARSGRSIPVPEGRTIVQALAEIGVKVDVSCEQGVCGTCICTVREGVPDHRDTYLTPDERDANDQMALCCSRAISPRLVLDL